MSVLALDDVRRATFVGDLHLGDGGKNDAFGNDDERLATWLARASRARDAIVFMGDVFDLPQAFAPARIRRAHGRALRALEEASARTTLVFIRGNHDWDAPFHDLVPGAQVCDELVLGDLRAFHGHQLDPFCDPEDPRHRRWTVMHHLFERALGFSFRVPLHEYDSTRNRAAHVVGAAFGRHLARRASARRRRGQLEEAKRAERFIHYWSRSVWGDPHALFEPVRAHVRLMQETTLVTGHTHLPGVAKLTGGRWVNAGSWTFGAAQVAEWDEGELRVVDVGSGARFDDEEYRWMIEGHDPGDFFAWWRAHYRGGLRFSFPHVRNSLH